MRNKFISGTTAQSLPDMVELEQLMALRGITGISPESILKRVVRYCASDNRVDSMGDVILASAWNLDEWLANPQFLLQHNAYDTETLLGRGLDAKSTPAGLFCDVFFFPPELAVSEKTEAIFKLVKAGAFPDCSVGFRPENRGYHWPTPEEEKSYEGISGVIYTAVKLKELSAVTIGANVGAKVAAVAKSLHLLNPDEVKSLGGSSQMAYMVDAAMFQIRGPTQQIQMPANDIFAGQLADISKELASIREENAQLSKDLHKKAEDVPVGIPGSVLTNVIVLLGSAIETLGEYATEDGTPASEEPVSESMRNFSALVSKVEQLSQNAKG